jgi:hypothetical protein
MSRLIKRDFLQDEFALLQNDVTSALFVTAVACRSSVGQAITCCIPARRAIPTLVSYGKPGRGLTRMKRHSLVAARCADLKHCRLIIPPAWAIPLPQPRGQGFQKAPSIAKSTSMMPFYLREDSRPGGITPPISCSSPIQS